MTGKTHLAVGIGATLIAVQPRSISELSLCIGASAVGSIISDIDIKGSGSRKMLNKTLLILAVSLVILVLVELKWKFGIYSSLSTSVVRMLTGFFIFIGICIYGKSRPHRTFMHSLLGFVLISVAANIIIPEASVYFAVGMLSHIIIDMLNYKKVNILYPAKFGVSLDVCKADGIVNKVLFYVGILLVLVYFVLFFF